MPRLTPELLAGITRVSDPCIDADGSRVAFVVAPVAKKGEHSTSEIWLVDAGGGDEHRITSGIAEDKAPRISPDGRQLAFLSDRAKRGTSQLLLMSLSGGEALPLTERKSSVSAPSWSPDGRRLAFLSRDEPTEAEENDKKERRDANVEDADPKVDRLYVVDLDSHEVRRVSPQGRAHVWDYCWAPDSTGMAAVVTPTCKLDESWRENRLIYLPVAETDATRLIFSFGSGIGHPVWSPDGVSIAFLAKAGRVSTEDQVHVASVASGKHHLVTKGFAGSVWAIEWVPDSNRLIAITLENMYGTVSEILVSSGRVRSILPAADRDHGSFGRELSLDSTGKRFAVVRSDSSHPHEIYVGRAGRSLDRVTNQGADLEKAGLRPAEPVEWQSVDGLAICGLLIRPDSAFAPPFPLFLIIHGGPASSFADRLHAGWHDWAQLLAANGYAVLMPNPRGSIGRGAAFTDANFRDLGGLEMQDDLAGVDKLVREGIVDPKRLAVGGWSHGGYMVAWMVTQTDRFKAAIMGAGVSNMISDQGTNDIPSFNLDYFYDSFADMYDDPTALWDRSPLKYVNRVTTPTLVLHGGSDARVAPSQGREFYRALKSLGKASEMVTYPREPHGLREQEHQIDVQRRILGWLERYLPAR